MPSVYPIEWQPITRTGRYRHMSKLDLTVWEKFLARAAAEWTMVAYDVALGGVMPATLEISDDERRGWQYSTAMKLDALLRNADGITIVEVKPEASTAGIGAAACYRVLAERELPDLGPVSAMLVCDFASADSRYCAGAFGVRIENP